MVLRIYPMQRIYHITKLLRKVFKSSFLINTPKGKVYVTPGYLFGYPQDKYFYLDEVVQKILDVMEITQSRNIDVYDVHDLLYASWIELREPLKPKRFINSK